MGRPKKQHSPEFQLPPEEERGESDDLSMVPADDESGESELLSGNGNDSSGDLGETDEDNNDGNEISRSNDAGGIEEVVDKSSAEAMETESHPEPTVEENAIPAGRSSLADVPKTGIRVYLTRADLSETICFFKKTRRLEKGRWILNGKWCDAMTGKDITFEPLYWRPMDR